MPADADISISFDGLSKTFVQGGKTVRALEDLSLQVPEGEILCLVGPSGCGKTTLLRCIAGIEEATAGTVKVEKGQGRQEGAPLSMVFQQHGLFPWMSVEDNLRFVLKAGPIDPARHGEIIGHFFERVGLSRFRSFFPYQLSGGMNQRVALIRAFCVYPRVLLMDEPFVFLDYQNRMILQELLLQLWQEQKQTIIFVTHNINEALTLGDRVMVMTASPGRFKREVRCRFPRPRDVVALRKDPEYGRMVVEITEDLKEEIRDAEKQQEERWLSSRKEKGK